MNTAMLRKIYALGLAALMTTAVLAGLDGLARDEYASAQLLAQAASQSMPG